MIVLDLLGGLGNQLFVWAAGRALEMNGQEVAYCTCRLEADPGRRYLLGDMGLKPNIINRHIGNQWTECSLRYHPEIFDLRDDWTLHGYFQSEKYWSAELQNEIRGSISVSLSPKSEIARLAILNTESCFVHMRRSDNLSPRGLSFHGLTTSQYYLRASELLFREARFFLFSDDSAWCVEGKEHLTDETVIVDCNPPSFTIDDKFELTKNDHGREVEDLWLMSLCKHAICANSSFSWWAAWLGDIPDVIVPDPWFADPSADSTDIVPERWQKVSIK